MQRPGLASSPDTTKDEMTPAEWSVCWQAFTNDASCAVTVIDAQGVVHYMNQFGRDLIGLKALDTIEGRNLSEFIPGPIHDARMALVSRVLQNGSSIAVLGAIAGLFRRTVYRALDNTKGHERVLTVCVPLCQPVGLADLVGPEQVYCEMCLDLGALSTLTERELQVLRLIGLGLSTHEIAERLHRSKKTIECTASRSAPSSARPTASNSLAWPCAPASLGSTRKPSRTSGAERPSPTATTGRTPTTTAKPRPPPGPARRTARTGELT